MYSSDALTSTEAQWSEHDPSPRSCNCDHERDSHMSWAAKLHASLQSGIFGTSCVKKSGPEWGSGGQGVKTYPKALSIRFAKTGPEMQGFRDPQVGLLRKRFPTDGRRGSVQARFPNKGLHTTRFQTTSILGNTILTRVCRDDAMDHMGHFDGRDVFCTLGFTCCAHGQYSRPGRGFRAGATPQRDTHYKWNMLERD